ALQGGDQAQVLEDARMQLVREVPQALGELAGACLQAFELRLKTGATVGEAPRGAAEGDRLCRKLLADSIVDLAGNAPTLLLLSRQEPPGEAPDRFLAAAGRVRGAMSLQRVGERLGQELESRIPLVRPPVHLTDSADRQAADDRAVPDE